MTRPYEATGRTCIECGAEVEDYIGHWQASEVTLCEECYPDHHEKWQFRVEVVHKVPKKKPE